MAALVAASLALVLGGCGGSEHGNPNSGGLQDVPGVPGVGSPMMSPTGDPGGDPTEQPPTTPGLPPEVEIDLGFQQPQASERFVYAANPESGTVSIIDAETLAIQTLETGRRPTYLRTLAGSDDAIVLDAGGGDAAVIRDPESGARSQRVPVVAGANAIAVAPDGAHAVVYFDARSGDTSSGSFQDVSVLRLQGDGGQPSAVDMTVGFRPRGVFFSDDGTRAYVVTEDGISLLDFAAITREGRGIARSISLGDDIDQRSADVSVTPDGRYALARAVGASALRLVDLESGAIRSLELSPLLPAPAGDGDADAGAPDTVAAEVTDLDLSPGGEFALAVARSHGALLRIPVPGGFEDASSIDVHVIEGEIIGSAALAPDGRRALLYTTAAAAERVTLVDLGQDEVEPRTVALRKAIEALAIAPDSATALIVHTKVDGDPTEAGIDPDLAIDRSYGYSVLRLDSADVKLQVTPTRPGAFTIVPPATAGEPGEGYIFILFRDDALGVRQVHRIEARSFLVHPLDLLTPPISLGAVPVRRRVFVNEQHPDGRITFIDWQTGVHQTVTGFELNSRIRD